MSKTKGLPLEYSSDIFSLIRTNPILPASPPSSPVVPHSPQAGVPQPGFDPRTCKLTPSDSVLLPIEAIPGYLDRALAALQLHVEARTSFITYVISALWKMLGPAMRPVCY